MIDHPLIISSSILYREGFPRDPYRFNELSEICVLRGFWISFHSLFLDYYIQMYPLVTKSYKKVTRFYQRYQRLRRDFRFCNFVTSKTLYMCACARMGDIFLVTKLHLDKIRRLNKYINHLRCNFFVTKCNRWLQNKKTNFIHHYFIQQGRSNHGA